MPATSPNWLDWPDLPVFTTADPTHGVTESGVEYEATDADPADRCLAEDGVRMWACALPAGHDGKHLPCTFELLEERPNLLLTRKD